MDDLGGFPTIFGSTPCCHSGFLNILLMGSGLWLIIYMVDQIWFDMFGGKGVGT